MIVLRQSTGVTIPIGPFVDETDARTPETGLTLTQADYRLAKNAGAFAQKNSSTAGTHMENGYYTCVLDTTDTNTVGMLKIHVNEAGALPVWIDALVVSSMIYDSWTGADIQEVDIIAVMASGTSALNLLRTTSTVIDASTTATTLTTTTFTTNVTGYSADQLIRRSLRFRNNACNGETVTIVDYSATGGQIWVAPPLTTAPSSGDGFVIF